MAALHETALKVLREKGLAKAAKRGGRATSEGKVASYIHGGGVKGVMVEETRDAIRRVTSGVKG